jgi:hypothetical protein
MNKQKLTSIYAALCAIMLIVPTLAVAQTAPSAAPTTGVCSDTKKAQQALTAIQTYVQTGPFSAQTAHAQTDGASILSARASLDAERAKAIETLTTSARTSKQKLAVSTFTNEVQTAVAERRAAVDASLSTYKDGIAHVATDPKTLITPPLQYANTVVGRVRQAVEDCKAALMRLAYTAEQIDSLSAARAAAIAKADEVYRTRIQNAISTVSAFFK